MDHDSRLVAPRTRPREYAVNGQKHARIKSIFLEVVEAPEQQRDTILHRVCAGDQELIDEVKSLLDHHDRETLILAGGPAPPTKDEQEVARAESVVPQPKTEFVENTQLVLAELWQENRALLQSRLRMLAIVLVCIMAYAVTARLLTLPARVNSGRLICLVVGTLIALVLSYRDLRLRLLRAIEVLVMGNIGLFIVVTDFYEMERFTQNLDPALVTRVSLLNYFSWSLLILIYGIFIPNTWQRAALVLIPIAFIPYINDSAMRHYFPDVVDILGPMDNGVSIPLVAAGVAICAASVIHVSRLSAFRARRFAQYRLIGQIGAGGMGAVYEARHVMLKRPCAIKVIHPERLSDRSQEKFDQEVRATSRLTHPNTVQIYDYGQTQQGLFFYVMEMLPGKNLQQLVDSTGPLPAGRAIYLLSQVCGALAEAHDKGLIHRDVKPANIIVSERGGLRDWVKLLDFGLVRQTDLPQPSKGKTRVTAGTPDYMSPEQFVEYTTIDARSDLYSLGAVAYFVVTGQPPFHRENQLKTLLAHATEAVREPIMVQPEIGYELNQIILKCLEKLPEDRFQSASELKDALDGCSLAGSWTQNDAQAWWDQAQQQSRDD